MTKKKNQNHGKPVRVFLTGGGTGGSVTPLLAFKKDLEKEGDYEFYWIGSKKGVEKEMVEKEGLSYKSIPAGKLRRYFSFKNFIDPFKIFFAFFKSLFILLIHRPRLVMSAGSFVSVPFVWAAWVLRRPVLIHQQDVRPGLANKLMAPFAKVITVTFEKSLKDYGSKARWVGNIISDSFEKSNDSDYFEIKDDLKVVLVVGGGTGAQFLNELVEQNLKELTGLAQVIHVAGKNKASIETKKRYLAFEFLEHDMMIGALKRADVVVSRCGLGFLTELSYFAKPSVLIPIPDSHQEDNAKAFQNNEAAIVLNQKEITTDNFINNIKTLLNDDKYSKQIGKNANKVIKIGNKEVLKIAKKLIK